MPAYPPLATGVYKGPFDQAGNPLAPTLTTPKNIGTDSILGTIQNFLSNPSNSKTLSTQQGSSMPAATSFYDAQKQNFQNPLDVIRQGGSLTGGPTTPQSVQGQNLSQNLATAPDLTALTDLVNTLNRNAQQQANQARIPNDPALEAASSANIGSELGGQLPPDVVRNIQQSAAERGVAIGSPGSDNSNSAMLRALGLDTLGLQQQGQVDLSRAVVRNPAAPLFDPTSQLLTPYQAGNLQNQSALIGLDWYKALMGGGAGGGGQGRRYGQGTDATDPGTAAANNAWWNSLFPAATAPGVPVAGPNLYTGNSYTAPDGSSLTMTNQNFGNLFGDPSTFQDYFTPPPNTVTTDTSSTYDPFAQYGDFING